MPASLLIPLAFGLCIMMLGVFLNAKKSDFLELRHNAKAVFFIAAMQFLLVPAVGFLFVYGLKNMPQYQAMSFGVWLIALCPGGIMSNYFSARAHGNVAVSAFLTILSSLMSCVTIPLGIGLFSLFAVNDATQNLVEKIYPASLLSCFCILMPFLLSVFIQRLLPQFVLPLARLCQYSALLLIALIIALALRDNWQVFTQSWQYYLPLVLLFNLALLTLAYWLCRWANFTIKTARTAAFEIGIQNSTVALLVLPIVAPDSATTFHVIGLWGVWHLVTGLLLSTYWGRAKA